MDNTQQPESTKMKKVYTKRKQQILNTIAEDEKNTGIQVEEKQVEEKQIEEKKNEQIEQVEKVKDPPDEDEPPSKRIRVTKEPAEQEQPNALRGALVKPVMLAVIAAASFWVNNLYNTSTPLPTPKPLAVGIKKKIVSPIELQSTVFQIKATRPSIVPGFTTTR